MSCSQCTELSMFKNEGSITFYSRYPEVINAISPAIKTENIVAKDSTSTIVSYFSHQQLHDIFEVIGDIVTNQFGSKIDLYISIENSSDVGNSFFPPMLPFTEVFERVKHPKLLQVIKESYFTNHIQPIISVSDQEVIGYEFLLRSSREEFPFTPFELFKFAQVSGLQAMLDGNARKQAIKYSAETLQAGLLRFINFLPSSIYNPKHCLKSTFENIEKYRVDPNDLVFEVVETEEISNINHLKDIFKAYKNEGIKVALDDIGAGYSTIEVLKELRPNYAKIDRKLISYCDQSKEKQEALRSIIDVAREYNIKTLAEGIERKEELDLCRELHFDLAQGYYIGKPNAQPMLDLVELP
ncbi:EAL domain-containing protein (putative c-di-GMP-specific phosphodiesterase class I) [Bacillus mesophilus]|uniref:EAL domain-containing protein n=1 Tax=Bacillus mesophilus TaxID=1808955 RepID=A0A6M0Q278_9BACI|nr:EAL domain-containing protein [Bacillus mesophilus]MBM7659616.1 EAL domain-containing protein (putative c-di-GMP-specific phosphodiesterase class I) [Bacillus mesophilus]NEY70485.1 EAL domain-containing protein [Bacillus mesophilus]